MSESFLDSDSAPLPSDVAIRVEGLSKRYHLGLKSRRAEGLRHVLQRLFSPRERSPSGSPQESAEEFWALREVAFEVKRGEIVGVVGSNGAGKSTLLKILSRITTPTSGRIKISGRLGSLLEVGTGFHPELTGRENIFLNGSMLGMRRSEVQGKFDEIVAFAEVERFLDTPVKHYSSGMYVRLAFAVAAHLEPEILIVDEVLAVGDAQFQKKCLGRMEKAAQAGRTVLFVSHNLQAVSALCTSGLLLSGGRCIFQGTTMETIHRYLAGAGGTALTEWVGDVGDETGRLTKTWARTLDPEGLFHTAAEIEIGIRVVLLRPVRDLILGFRIVSEFGTELVYSLFDDLISEAADAIPPGELEKRFIIPRDFLGEGRYQVRIAFGIHNQKAIVLNTVGTLDLHVQNVAGLGRVHLGVQGAGFQSIIRPRLVVS